MIWKTCTRRKRLSTVVFGLLFSVCIVSPFVLGCSVSAISKPLTSADGKRTYKLLGSSAVIAQDWNCDSFPCSLIGGGAGREFSGYRFSIVDPTLRTTDQNWSFSLTYEIQFSTDAWIQDFDLTLSDIPFAIGSYGHGGTCTASGYNNGILRISCVLSGSSTEYFPTDVQVRFGDVESFVPNWEQKPGSNSNSPILFLNGAVYEFNSGNDPDIALLQAQISLMEQQQTLTQQTNNKLDVQSEKLDDLISAVEEQKQEEQEREEQDREDIENTQDDVQDSADDSADEAGQVGSSLISAFSSLVSALHDVSVSDCKLPDFTLFSLDFSDMDLCQFSTPSGLMALGSIGMVFVIVPMGIALVKQLLGLYNEIIGGQ